MLSVVDSVDPFSVIGLIAGAIGALVAAWVGVKGLTAKRQVDRFELTLTATDQSVAHLTASLDRADKDMARMQGRIDYLSAAIEHNNARHIEATVRCNTKLRRLGAIVRELGGEVPDELGDHDH